MGRKRKTAKEGEDKTMKELTKGFEEFMKNKKTRLITRKKESDESKEDFDQLLEKASKPKKR